MNKSVVEQTSRTYAEIEKTLDHSEVSVALSSVQEDVDSPRVVRRVEGGERRPPPAVSEEDLSVASLLDIPSWADPVEHSHSESIHDLLEELEIPQELNPNIWNPDDVNIQEPTSYTLEDEQADEMDIPPQSISEETYKDENGHIIVKKVTRKVIRKCASSSDGAELEQISSEADSQVHIRPSKGDDHSKLIKRSIVKSEGDQSEVIFTEREALLKQDQAEGGRVTSVEKRVVLEGERPVVHHDDGTLAKDVSSAQDNFRQGPDA
ncbi:hypothetical protein WMY93_005814 [Mugilogobius chulae]|uniref:Uncharacterized protein n=1 Tax=Mugilogobius chulae TaxID=88201 RepID=A0AAW0PRX9_9GOBI